MVRTKRIIAGFMVLVMMVPFLTACQSKLNKELVSAAKKYTEALAERDVKNIVKYSTPDAKTMKDNWTSELDISTGYSDSKKEIFEMIIDSMTMEVDSKSIDADQEEGTIDIVINMLDYESVLEDVEDFDSADEFIEALSRADTKEFKMILNLERVDGEWKVSNSAKVINRVYAFLHMEIVFNVIDSVPSCDDVREALINAGCSETDWYGYYAYEGTFLDTRETYSCFDATRVGYERVVSGRTNNNIVVIAFEFYDVNDAFLYFSSEIYDTYNNLTFQGSYEAELTDTSGYLLISTPVISSVRLGDIQYNSNFAENYIYGGVYFVDNTVVIIMDYDTNNSALIGEVDSYLDAFGLMRP